MGVCDSNNKKLVKSKQFFGVCKTITEDNFGNEASNNQIKLELTIKNRSPNYKDQVMAEFLNSNIDPFYTETVKSHQSILTFNTCYICEFLFQNPQLMRISLFKNGKNIGSFTPYLGNIVGSPNSIFETSISPDKKEILKISAQGISNCNDLVMCNFIIKTNNNVDFNNINNKISFMITCNERKIYSSESISKYGQFKTTSIPKALLEPQFEVIFLNCAQQKIVSKLENISNFTGQNNNNLYLNININNNDYYIFNKSQLLKQYSFIDYIKNGVQLALSIGIDFTSSNGQINDPYSLHRIIPGSYNDYEQAIISCGLIVAFYDYDQLFPVYGFGAIINNVPKPNMCFNINFQENPEIYTIDNVIEEYRKCLKKIIFAGPTEFCPMIRKEIEIIKKENNPLIYHVLMILTDGVIVDQQDTKDAIIEASFLPFSLIIIGIGNDHFQEMKELDGDNIPLISSNGIKRLRDVVQFVQFNKFRHNQDELAKHVLAEIPKQIIEYYTMNKIYPNNLSGLKLRTRTMMENNNILNY